MTRFATLRPAIALVAILSSLPIGPLCILAHAQVSEAAPADLPTGVSDVVKLTKAGLSEDVIIAQIKASGCYYKLSTDQIIYLNNSGVSQNVLRVLMSSPLQAPAAAPAVPQPIIDEGVAAPVQNTQVAYSQPATAQQAVQPLPVDQVPSTPPTQVSAEYFQQQLAPYGQWVQTPNGAVWVPAAASTTPGWRPYSNDGRWVYTDEGLFWQSDVPWGDVVFHYGRWNVDPNYGWVWTPGYNWSPAWVAWRHGEAEGFIGWAPLPPAAVFEPTLGLVWEGHHGEVMEVEFGLTENAYVFIGADHFWEHDYHAYYFGHERIAYFYGRSHIYNGYHFEHGRFRVEGLGRERLGAFTRHEIRVERAHEMRMREERAHFAVRHEIVRAHVAAHPEFAMHGAAPHAAATHAPMPNARNNPAAGRNPGPAEQHETPTRNSTANQAPAQTKPAPAQNAPAPQVSASQKSAPPSQATAASKPAATQQQAAKKPAATTKSSSKNSKDKDKDNK